MYKVTVAPIFIYVGDHIINVSLIESTQPEPAAGGVVLNMASGMKINCPNISVVQIRQAVKEAIE